MNNAKETYYNVSKCLVCSKIITDKTNDKTN